jgi:hypothetical protein
MTNFKQLEQKEYDEVWDKFYALFHFNPSVSHFPAIKTSKPQLKLDIKSCFSPNYPVDQLEQFAINLFNKISNDGDRLYALNWHHDCYDFDPKKQMDKNEFGEWIVPVLPNGDYYIFLTKDFGNIWFGHPWEQTIALIGDSIVKHGQEMKNFLLEIE